MLYRAPLSVLRAFLFGVFSLLSFLANGQNQVILIPNGNVADHGNPYLAGSIAQRFLQGKQNTRYVLTDSDSDYRVAHTLRLPAGSTLASLAGGQARLLAVGEVEHMIRLQDGSRVEGLSIDANNIAFTAIYGRDSNRVAVVNNTIRNSRSGLDFLQCLQDEIRTHLVSIWDSSGIRVHNNTLENAGLPASGPPSSACAVKSNSLSLKNSAHVSVSDNTIRNSASGGIDATDSIFVTIIGNHIEGSGANRTFYGDGDRAKASDGIVAYANPMRHPLTNFYRIIHDNTIVDWGNHAIHVSGRMHSIRGNRIMEPRFARGRGGHGIYVGDRPNHIGGIQCSSYIWIEENTIQSANEAIVVDYYNSATLRQHSNRIQSGGTLYRNAGCNSAEW